MLTVKQAAERLGISPALVYALVGQRKIRHERYGLGRGCIRIPPDALEEYRSRCTVAAGGTKSPQPPPANLEHIKL